MKQRVLLVSNRLPVAIDTSKRPYHATRSLGGLATSLGAISRDYETVWVGWAGNEKPLSRQQFTSLVKADDLVPLNIPRRLFHHHYDRVANAILWPILHSMQPPITARPADWNAARKVAEQFAEVIIEQLHVGDIIWVHDFHLMLLVQALRARGVTNKIGFFLHTPFPQPAIFMTVNAHQQLLTSLAMADLIGFQTPQDMANFIATLKKAEVRPSVQMHTGVFPIGIDFAQYADAQKLPDVSQQYDELRRLLDNHYVVLSVSRLDYTKGILEQLEAFEKAVLDNSLGDITYRLVVAPSRESRIEYRRLERKIAHLVVRINKRFRRHASTAHISFEYRNHSFAEVSAWYRRADMLLITPRVDGMNLVVKEYLAVRSEPGTLVLSKTAGAAVQLPQAILVNPTDIADIAAGITKAYHMDAAERKERWHAMRNNIKTETIFTWAKTFLGALVKTTP